jgi:hypothetical protein
VHLRRVSAESMPRYTENDSGPKGGPADSARRRRRNLLVETLDRRQAEAAARMGFPAG